LKASGKCTPKVYANTDKVTPEIADTIYACLEEAYKLDEIASDRTAIECLE